jgi:DNA-binding NarL/FixJ family response regulator
VTARKSTAATIVVVDDSEIILELVRDTLEQQGFRVITRCNPFGFSNLLKQEQPVLALVDVSMPALMGPQLVQVAQRAGGHCCPIVLFSDRAESELATLVQQCGAAGYIRKNGDMRHLVQAIRAYLRL